MQRRPPIRSYQDLIVWQKAIQLLVAVNRIIRRIPTPERYDFARQMRRAALSVSANIAEGFGRDHLGDFLRHLSIARASVMEVESDLLALRALSLVPERELGAVISSADQIGRMLATHARKLRSRSGARPGPRAFFHSELGTGNPELTVAPPQTSASDSPRQQSG
jgi:four helix bundle protein